MAKPKTKLKSLTYRRAIWLGQTTHKQNVQQLVQAALSSLPHIENTRVKRGDQVLELRHREVALNAHAVKPLTLLHISAYTPAEAASTVPMAQSGTVSHDLATAKAPHGSEFLDGDILALLHENNVCLCASFSSEQTLTAFIYGLLKLNGVMVNDMQFELQRVANRKGLRKLMQAGVREVTIDFSAYEASMQALSKKSSGAMKAALSSIFGPDQKVSRVINQAGMQALVTLRADGRTAHGAMQRELAGVAQDVIDEKSEGFTIVTKNGDRVSSEELTIRRFAHVERHGKTVDYKDGWKKLTDFYENVDENDLNKV